MAMMYASIPTTMSPLMCMYSRVEIAFAFSWIQSRLMKIMDSTVESCERSDA